MIEGRFPATKVEFRPVPILKVQLSPLFTRPKEKLSLFLSACLRFSAVVEIGFTYTFPETNYGLFSIFFFGLSFPAPLAVVCLSPPAAHVEIFDDVFSPLLLTVCLGEQIPSKPSKDSFSLLPSLSSAPSSDVYQTFFVYRTVVALLSHGSPSAFSVDRRVPLILYVKVFEAHPSFFCSPPLRFIVLSTPSSFGLRQ